VSTDEFDRVRAEADPLVQARLATDLLAEYQQRSVELARLRRDAIERAAAQDGMTYTAVAAALGLSKGRITQIRQTAPPSERAFFGVGPVTIAVPERTMPGRALPVISAEDTLARQTLGALLAELNFQVVDASVPAVGEWELPRGDLVAICGPKSSPTVASILATDPRLSFGPDSHGRWVITDGADGTVYGSPMDQPGRASEDVAYVGRLRHGDRSLLVIAGVHAIGSLGAVDYLRRHLADVYPDVDEEPFSMVVRSRHDGATILDSEAACPPRTH
jgi:hypothetical protein